MKKKLTETDIYHGNKYLQLGKSFSVLQKRAIHFVVKELQNELYLLNEQKKGNVNIERTLFGDAYFDIPAKSIDPTNQDTQIRNALRGLKIPIDDDNFIGDFMLSAKREGGNWRLLFPEKTVHFLTEVSKGVTPLQTIVYLTAQSKYTVRMYELLMRFRDTGIWHTNPEDIANLFDLPETYRNDFGRLRQGILEKAKKELHELYKSNQSDIYFTYEETKSGRGNKVTKIKFSIFWREKSIARQDQDGKDLAFVSDNLNQIMITNIKITKHQKKANEEFINRALSKLIETGNLKNFLYKLENKILQNTKVAYEDKGGLARYILIEDFQCE
jgi:hypothetical protein